MASRRRPEIVNSQEGPSLLHRGTMPAAGRLAEHRSGPGGGHSQLLGRRLPGAARPGSRCHVLPL
jgi:hypothetical protein